MIEIALVMLGGALVLNIILFILKNLWVRFAWDVLGMRPRILDEKLAVITADECAKIAVKLIVADAKESGWEPTQKQVDEQFSWMKRFGEEVITQYTYGFTRMH